MNNLFDKSNQWFRLIIYLVQKCKLLISECCMQVYFLLITVGIEILKLGPTYWDYLVISRLLELLTKVCFMQFVCVVLHAWHNETCVPYYDSSQVFLCLFPVQNENICEVSKAIANVKISRKKIIRQIKLIIEEIVTRNKLLKVRVVDIVQWSVFIY